MNFKAHATAGLTTAGFTSLAVFALTQDNGVSLTCAGIVFLMSLFPDLDTASKPSRYFAIIALTTSLILMYYQQYYYVSLIGMSFLCLKVGKHRGWTHKYSLPLGFLITSYIFPNFDLIWISFAVGLCVHYACDSMSPLKLKNWIDIKLVEWVVKRFK
jgi:hypothetical protein